MKQLIKILPLLCIFLFVPNHVIFAENNASQLTKPIVPSLTDKDTSINGTTEANTTVYAKIGNKTYKVYTTTTTFSIPIDKEQSLKAGTIVTLYSESNDKGKSASITVKVEDKTAPTKPTVKNITTKSFVISGKTEKYATVTIKKGTATIATIKTKKDGKFSKRIPLQKAGTLFQIYAVDSAKNKSLVTSIKVKTKNKSSKKLLSTPVISQMPQLDRGCEVTSLAMLLQHAGVKVDKMTLAKKVKKDPTPYQKANGKTYYGNPNTGFVGNIYTFSKSGYAVYDKPIEALADKYLKNRIINLTGSSFSTVENYVSAGHPVWVITTSTFNYVPSSYWHTWYTPTGKIKMTYKEHSVLITGYDSKYVYFNDPLDGKKNKKTNKANFIKGWKQFGNMAISYY